MMVGMQGIGWCDIGMGFRCVSGCSAVWVEIGAECVARESGGAGEYSPTLGALWRHPSLFALKCLQAGGLYA